MFIKTKLDPTLTIPGIKLIFLQLLVTEELLDRIKKIPRMALGSILAILFESKDILDEWFDNILNAPDWMDRILLLLRSINRA